MIAFSGMDEPQAWSFTIDGRSLRVQVPVHVVYTEGKDASACVRAFVGHAVQGQRAALSEATQ